jgi:hypothetical protein
MALFAVFRTQSFLERFSSLEKREQEWIEKMEKQLQVNSFAGKPLGFKWFREKKFENKRLYFLVNEQKEAVLLVAFAPKKEQQKIIDYITTNKEEYRKLFELL